MMPKLHQAGELHDSPTKNPVVLDGYAAIAASGPKQTKSYKSSLVQGGATTETTRYAEHTSNGTRVPPPQSKAEKEKETPLIPKEQICFDFTKGQCRRGSGCKFSHDVGYIIRVNSQEKGICFDFLKGACKRGVLCRFSHDLNNLKPMLDRREQEEGNHGVIGGKHGPSKKKSICYDFVKNNCDKGDSCRYSHDYTALYNQVHKRKTQSSEQTNPNVPASQDATVCIDYLRGHCSRGMMCTMTHAGKSQQVDVPPTAGLVTVPMAPHGNPETLDDLIARLKKMQYEESMMKKEEQYAAGMSYPPPSMSHGARLMDAYHHANHETHMHSPLRMDLGGLDFPMSPPVTHAEKARVSLRNQLLHEGAGSPMIPAGWNSPLDVKREYSSIEQEQPLSPIQQSQDLHSFLSMQSIWSQHD